MGAFGRRRFRLQSPLRGCRKGGLGGLQLLKCPFWGWRSALPLLALLLAGGAFALATSSAGRADDPPPTTVSTPTLPAPVPAPDPSPRCEPPRKLPTPKTTAREKPRAATQVTARRLDSGAVRTERRGAPSQGPTEESQDPSPQSPSKSGGPTPANGARSQVDAASDARSVRSVSATRPARSRPAHSTSAPLCSSSVWRSRPLASRSP